MKRIATIFFSICFVFSLRPEDILVEVYSHRPETCESAECDVMIPQEEMKKSCVEEEPSCEIEFDDATDPCCCKNDPRWYLIAKPGYFYFTDSSMREFYGNGGFSFMGELGYQIWGPLYGWLEGSYFQKQGKAIGGNED